MIDDAGSTVGDIHGDRGEQKAIQGSTEPGTSSQKETHSVVHQHGVPKRVADSHIAVIGHEAQQEELWSNHGQVEEDLGAAGHKGNGLLYGNHVHEELWDGSTNEKGVHDRQLAEQKVHGGMEVRVYVDQEDHDPINYYGHEEDGTNDAEKEARGFVVSEEPCKGEVTGKGLIISIHGFKLHLEA